ncbi:MAG: iron-sulfur cluster assembly accessory protein [Bacteroidetes bacterium]|nr:iron-sulfur cluster assembly accessory protein [Bacteroidota bacterium]
METLHTSPVRLSGNAVVELKRLISLENSAEVRLRIGVRGGGCSGMTYILEFGNKEKDDLEFEIDGIFCLMNKAHEIYLDGMQIDWEPGLNSRGFVFINPNASSTCGCGSSFGV